MTKHFKEIILTTCVMFLSSLIFSQTVIQMEKKNGVYYVPCSVNGLELQFIFDTGAGDVSISLSEALFMIKNGYISENDLIGTQYYRIANGEIAEGTKIIIKELKIGDKMLFNVQASIVHTLSAPLLLGQSAIERFGKFSVDYNTNTLVLGASSLPSNISSKNYRGGYKIKFNIKQLNQGTIKLAYYYGDKQYVKDTAIVDKTGKVEFAGKEDLPAGIYLVVFPSTRYFEILVDKEQKFTVDVDTTDLIFGVKITGSKDNSDFYQYLQEINKTQKDAEKLKKQMDEASNEKDKETIKAQLVELEKEYKNIKTRFIQQNPEALLSKVFKAAYEPEIPEAPLLPNGKKDSTFAYRYFKTHYFDQIDMKDERLIRSPVLANKVKTYMEKLTPQIPDSINKAADVVIGLSDGKNELYKWLVYWITNNYEKSNMMGMDAVFVHMAKEYYLSGKAYWIDTAQQNKIRKRVNDLEPNLIGKKAVNLKLLKPDLNQTQLYDIKNAYTILYFWDPSCGHCQKVTPKLNEFYDAYKKEFDLEVFAVYTETDTTEWFKTIKEKKLNWINAADLLWNTNFKKYYDIYSTPVIYILDRQKKIIAKRIDVEQLPDFLRNHKKFEATKLQTQ